VDLDGASTFLATIAAVEWSISITISTGKTGMLLEADTTTYYESVIMEVDFSGAVLKT